MDKGYYDYDYSEPQIKEKHNISKASDPDKLAKKLARLGMAQPVAKPMTAEEMQRIAMEELKRKQA